MTVTAVQPLNRVTASNSKVIPIREELDGLNKEQFIMAKQGIILNDLLKVAPKKDSYRKDKFADKESFKFEAIELVIHEVTGITSSFNTSTKQLLDILIIYYNQQGCNGRVNVHLDDYMTIRGLTDKKSARKKVNEIIKLLCNSFITCKSEELKKLDKTYNNIPLMETAYIKNSFIVVEFSEQFSEIIKESPVMPYPLELLEINGKKNPNSFNFLRKIAELENMNSGRIIAVNTLLDNAETISPLEVVRKTNKHINKNIIVPFERDLNALSNVLSWEYREKGDIPISKKEIEALKYDEIIGENGLYIKINWHDYPDQSERLNKQKDRKSKS